MVLWSIAQVCVPNKAGEPRSMRLTYLPLVGYAYVSVLQRHLGFMPRRGMEDQEQIRPAGSVPRRLYDASGDTTPRVFARDQRGPVMPSKTRLSA